MNRTLENHKAQNGGPARGTIVAALLGVAALSAVAISPAALAQSSTSPDTYRQLNLFGEVFERVRDEYVETVSDQELIEAAINGMLISLDPHSNFLSSKSYRDMRVQTKGEFGGLGIEVTMENGVIKVVSPIDDTPASRAGLEPGDLITHLDGEAILGLTLGQAVEKMRGPVDSQIVLSVRRGEAKPFDVTIQRAIIKIRSVRHEAIGNVGYVRITTFNEQTTSGVQDGVAALTTEIGEKLAGFVIDLRNNPGGLLDQAISVSDAFLEKGEIVSTRGRDPNDTSRVHATAGDITNGKPIVLLINGGSASASEIVAGALQDHRRALVLGTQSFGKGSVQTIVPLPGDVAMRLTTARYYTPSGRSIQKTGISPDIAIPTARIEKIDGARRRETDLRNALENSTAPEPSDEQNPRPTGRKSAEERAEEDYQLARAVDLLRGISLLNTRMVN
jgi:carboxyl-terminal processing protease